MKAQIETAGLKLHLALDAIAFEALLAYKYGSAETLKSAREKMVKAIEKIDRTLAETDDAE